MPSRPPTRIRPASFSRWSDRAQSRLNLDQLPASNNSLARLGGADVLLLFVESYGAVTYETPAIADGLVASRADLRAAVAETDREVVSAYVESPTFGGSSWLAHLSLHFGCRGSRSVRVHGADGVEPRDDDHQLRAAWIPNGRADAGHAPGVARGRLLSTSTRSTAAICSTIEGRSSAGGAFPINTRSRSSMRSSAIACRASLCSWSFRRARRTRRSDLLRRISRIGRACSPRMRSPKATSSDAMAATPDLTNLRPSYVRAMAYEYATLAGYLRQHPRDNMVVVALGDHQPPAAVSGRGAPWSVPVHVFGRRGPILDRLLQEGFREGLEPHRPPIGPMHALTPMLLEAFSSPTSGAPHRLATQSPVASATQYQLQTTTPTAQE